jgi:lipid A 3-O-deacylase
MPGSFRSLLRQFSLLGLTASALVAQPCLAEAADVPDSTAQVQTNANFGYGKQELSIAAGYGFGVGIGGSNNGNLKDIRFAALIPRWGVGLTDPLAEGTWYEGNLDLLIEGAFLFEYRPVHGFSGGGTLVFRYNFLESGRVVPFIEAGAGIVGTDFDLKGQSDGFNFSVQGGLGLHFFVLPRVAITAEARLHHISDAGLRVPNNGINDSLLLLGASFFLK